MTYRIEFSPAAARQLRRLGRPFTRAVVSSDLGGTDDVPRRILVARRRDALGFRRTGKDWQRVGLA